MSGQGVALLYPDKGFQVSGVKPPLFFLNGGNLQSNIKLAALRRFLSRRKWPRGLCRISCMGCSLP